MIASWMLYCALCALGLALAAVLVERALLAGRGPVRHVWFGAVVLSLLVPVVAFRYAPRRVTAAPASVIVHEDTASAPIVGAVPADTTPHVAASNGAATAETQAAAPASPVNWRGIINGADRPLTIAWLALSIALAVYFLIGLILLARTRRAWGERVVLGVRVLVSERTGPALVGAVSPAIVVPEWALGLEPSQLSLMLRHEQEHQRAHDGQLLFAAQLALIAMPWNVALWWQILRLRVAVELDCDARVLRDADARSYGNLLLEVIRPRPALSTLGVASFAEHATQLERRILVMTRRRVAARGARVLAVCVVIAAVSLAWIAPRPQVPALPPVQSPAPKATVASTRDSTRDSVPTKAPVTPRATETRRVEQPPPRAAVAAPDSIRAPIAVPPTTPPAANDSAATRNAVRDSTRPDSVIQVATGRGGRGGGGGRGGVSIPNQVDAIFTRLFDSIALTPEQQAQARALVTDVVARQRALQDSALPGIMAFQTRAAELRAERDTALLALLTSDTARDTVRSRLTPTGRGGGGGQRGGGPGTVQTLAGGGRGTVPPSAGRGNTPVPLDATRVADVAYTRLFEGIVLTPDQETRARGAILRLETERRAAQPQPTRQLVGFAPVNGAIGVLMEAKTDSALMSLLGNDADKQKLRARMINPPPRIP